MEKMKISSITTSVILSILLFSGFAQEKQPVKPATPQNPASRPPAKTPPRKRADTADKNAAQTSQDQDTGSSPTVLIEQGKSFYRSVRFKEALARFEAALKKDPDNDEALGLAAVTAFRLDNQPQSREYFLRRADLAGQKDTIRSYCFYRIALTYWREAHDIVSKYGSITGDTVVFKLPETELSDARYKIDLGQDYAGRSLSITRDYIESHNIRNLLYAEAALIAPDERTAYDLRNKSLDSLRRSLELADLSSLAKRGDSADFNQPTVRIAELPRTKEEESILVDPMMRLVEGARAIKRVDAVFPRSSRPAKPKGEAPPEPESEPVNSSEVKVEILISTTGDVVFAHAVDGKSEWNGAAIIAARSWKFEPARFDGKPVQITGVITFLNKASKGK